MKAKAALAAGIVVVWCVGGANAVAAAPAAGKPAEAPKKPSMPTYVTVEEATKAGPDFKLQGEYEGTAGQQKIGVQVIALGDGAFQAVLHPGGLPGAGWDGKVRIPVDGKLEGGKAVFAPGKDAKKYMGKSPAEFSALQNNPAEGQKNYAATADGETLTGKTDTGQAIQARKVLRESPTLGAKPPPGALVLFDGSGVAEWAGGHMDGRKLLAAGSATNRTFTDFTLHLEFVTPFKPHDRSQGRGNSGMYLQHHYEVQILDSFGLEGLDNECGGIYKASRPHVNMCLPPLSWQTYDVDFTAPRPGQDGQPAPAEVTIRHNGVVIHDKLQLKAATPGGKGKHGEPGALFLQGHGNPVFFRNIWIVEKKSQ